MKDLVEKIFKNGVSVLSVKMLSLIHVLIVANFYNEDELSIYSYCISMIVFFGTSYVNIVSQYFSSKGVKSDCKQFCVLLHFVLTAISSLLIFHIYDWQYYFVVFVVQISTITYSSLLESQSHGKLAKQSSVSLFVTVFLIFILLYFEVSVINYLLVYSVPYIIYIVSNLGVIDKNSFIKIINVKSLYLLYLGSSFIPLGLVILYSYLEVTDRFNLVGEFTTIFQWFWIFGQINIVMNNALLNYKKTALINSKIETGYLISTLLPLSIISLIIPFTSLHNNLFSTNLDEDLVYPTFCFLFSVSFLSAFKSHIYREIVKENKYWLSLFGNLSWLFIFLCFVFTVPISNVNELSFVFFASNYMNFLLFTPLYFAKNLIYLRNMNEFIYFSLNIVALSLIFIGYYHLELIIQLIFNSIIISFLALYAYLRLVKNAKRKDYIY